MFGLPAELESLRVYRATAATGSRLFAEVLPREEDDGFDARVMDADGNVYLELSGYRTVAIPAPETMAALLEAVSEGAPA